MRASVIEAHGLRSTGSAVVVMQRLNCPLACEIFLNQGSNRVLCIGRQILNHWTTEKPKCSPRKHVLAANYQWWFAVFKIHSHVLFPWWRPVYWNASLDQEYNFQNAWPERSCTYPKYTSQHMLWIKWVGSKLEYLSSLDRDIYTLRLQDSYSKI